MPFKTRFIHPPREELSDLFFIPYHRAECHAGSRTDSL